MGVSLVLFCLVFCESRAYLLLVVMLAVDWTIVVRGWLTESVGQIGVVTGEILFVCTVVEELEFGDVGIGLLVSELWPLVLQILCRFCGCSDGSWSRSTVLRLVPVPSAHGVSLGFTFNSSLCSTLLNVAYIQYARDLRGF